MQAKPGTDNTNATPQLSRALKENRHGQAVGVYSICSPNRYVLEAGMLQALRDNVLLLIESSSNQVNQFGGYTGQNPASFATFVRQVAVQMNFPAERIVLGGDHLGPHVWRAESPEKAMAKARELVRDCVRAGYSKIHLDASMHLVGDPVEKNKSLADEIVSTRAAELCAVAEQAHREMQRDSPAPLYVIGTEVPIPGGEQLDTAAPETTRPQDLARTLRTAQDAFRAMNLEKAWERVVAVVVQPGVEFGDSSVFAYDHEKAAGLAAFGEKNWQGVFEAHSTDYQSAEGLREMVKDHFAILKVGPWFTFAFREAVFALAMVEEEWLGGRKGITRSGVREALDHAMVADPSHWKSYYHGDAAALHFARKYSYSDRSRYYWPQPAVQQALQRLLGNLAEYPAPLSLLSQYLPKQWEEIRAEKLLNDPVKLIHSWILEVIDNYAYACGMKAACP
ncbi:MAG: class II D-tagatose-bisphosphate aldolase, non-catalytic subunit [Candidatus Acidiferrum sp.]